MAQALDLPGTATQDPALSRAGVARNDVAASVLFARRRWHSRSRPLQSARRIGHSLSSGERKVKSLGHRHPGMEEQYHPLVFQG